MNYTYNTLLGDFKAFEEIGYPTPEKVHSIVAAVNAIPGTAQVTQQAVEAIREAVDAGDAEAARAAADAYALAASGGHNDAVMIAQGRTEALIAAFDLDAAYAFASRKYASIGATFARFIKTVDPDANPQWIATDATKAQREAWAAFPALCDELEHMVRLMVRLRNIAGLPTDFPDNPGQSLGLCVDAGTADVVDLLGSWSRPSQSRGGRWADAIRLGASLKAPATMRDHEPLAPPAPPAKAKPECVVLPARVAQVVR